MLLDRAQVLELFGSAIKDTEEQLFYEIKRFPERRQDLLAQLDVLDKVRTAIGTRIHTDN